MWFHFSREGFWQISQCIFYNFPHQTHNFDPLLLLMAQTAKFYSWDTSKSLFLLLMMHQLRNRGSFCWTIIFVRSIEKRVEYFIKVCKHFVNYNCSLNWMRQALFPLSVLIPKKCVVDLSTLKFHGHQKYFFLVIGVLKFKLIDVRVEN